MLILFAVTLFVSATLLFLVQPMVGKLILPRLGGTPAVWNTCMVFFQAVLLVGYSYTHTLSGWSNRRKQVAVQLAVLLLPFLVLPFSLGSWTPPLESNPVYSVLWLLLGMVGLPFFVVSTTAPLLQRWFAGTDHPAAKDPYFLYGASNLGSMLALLLYPILFEPLFPVEEQVWVWTGAYAVFVALVTTCAAIIWRASTPAPEIAPSRSDSPSQTAASAAPPRLAQAVSARPRRSVAFAQSSAAAAPSPSIALDEPSHAPLTWPRRLRWLALAAVPSSLMLGATSYLTTDIAAIPFFWVVPLSLYLLTFILVFARWPVVWTDMPHQVVLWMQPVILMALVFVIITGVGPSIAFTFFLHSLSFLFAALVCHGELARDRPGAHHLTEFYLWLSVGGVVGGLFNALFAPLVFRLGNVEYPAAMVMACFLRPSLVGKETLIPGDTNEFEKTPLGRWMDFVVPLFALAATLAVPFVVESESRRRLFYALPVMFTLALLCRPVRFGLALGLMLGGLAIYSQFESPYIYQDRGFFGFIKVRQEDFHRRNDKGEIIETVTFHTLVHGGINHGMQRMDEYRRHPITYFHPHSGIGQIFEHLKGFKGFPGDYRYVDARLPAAVAALGDDPWSALAHTQSEPPFAVIGLGIGTLAAHARPYQLVDIYEIDPLIRRLSLPDEGSEPYFYYVHDAIYRAGFAEEPLKAPLQIKMGDGRLRLRDAPQKHYHVIVLDAFSSDAIPLHLLTADAVDEYLDKLADGGVLVFNATNRYVDIRPVLADIAASRGMVCYYFGNEGDNTPTEYGSDWVILQRLNYETDKSTGAPRVWSGGPPLDERFYGTPALNPFGGHPQGWQRLRPSGARLWTDGYSNMLSVIRWTGRGN